MKKKILLIRIPEVEYNLNKKDVRSLSVGSLTLPLGITYIASVIEKSKVFDVEILDLYAEKYEEFVTEFFSNPIDIMEKSKVCLLNVLSQYKPDVVGFSAPFLYQHHFVKELAGSLKDYNPGIRLYLGGYPTLIPERVLEDIPEIDIAFIGESEKSIIKVLLAENKEKSLEKIDGIGYRHAGKTYVNKTLGYINDLGQIHYPLFSKLPLKKYKSILGRSELPLLTSRGCPFSCNFCSSHLYCGRSIRFKELDNLIYEIEFYVEKFDPEFLWIRDDNFIVNQKHAKQFLKKLIRNRLVIPWLDSSAFHVNSIDEELLDLCKESGCTEAILAVESGVPRVLKEVMNKSVDLEHAKKMAEYCRKIDLPAQAYFVIGNPGETKEEINKTISFAKELQVDHCVFSIATPFPGTRYYEIALKNNYLIGTQEEIINMKYMDVCMRTQECDAQYLKDVQYDANIRINFLENRLIYGDNNSLMKARKKYRNVSKQYNFHLIARLLEGYLAGQLGEITERVEIYKQVSNMLKQEEIKSAYHKYLRWNTPATNDFRSWSH